MRKIRQRNLAENFIQWIKEKLKEPQYRKDKKKEGKINSKKEFATFLLYLSSSFLSFFPLFCHS